MSHIIKCAQGGRAWEDLSPIITYTVHVHVCTHRLDSMRMQTLHQWSWPSLKQECSNIATDCSAIVCGHICNNTISKATALIATYMYVHVHAASATR